MDRPTLLAHLEMAERHIALGERHIREQQERITKIDSESDLANEARQLLALFFETQKQHIEHRDRLLGELKES